MWAETFFLLLSVGALSAALLTAIIAGLKAVQRGRRAGPEP